MASTKPTATSTPGTAPWPAGGGKAGALIRSVDWSRTPLGPIERWPQSLKTVLNVMLHARHPMFLWWGPELVQLYNDAYLPSFGQGKHPRAMGQPGRECWGEIWSIIWPQIDDVMSRGKASWNEDQLVPIFRNGKIEEVFWTYGYSPVFGDDGAIAGTLVVCTETTPRVLAERRLGMMKSLAEKLSTAADPLMLLRRAAEVCETAQADVPYALFYLRQPDSAMPSLAASSGLTGARLAAAGEFFLQRLTADRESSLRSQPASAVQGLEHLGLPGGPWPEPSTAAWVAPLSTTTTRPSVHVVFGLSPRLSIDAAYCDYLNQVTEQLELAQTRIEALRVRASTWEERDNLLLQAPLPTALLVGPDHVFVLANGAYCQMVNRFDLVGKTLNQAFPELEGTELPQIFDRVYAQGEPFVAEDFALAFDRRGDGTLDETFFKFNLQPLRDGAGQVYGMMAVTLEVTEEVRSRKHQQQNQAEREKLLTELESASRAKDEFLAMLGHELRNPLSPIVTALALMRLQPNDTAKAQQVIERQVKHLIRLVDDLLDVSKITTGKVELQKEMLELSEVVAKAVEIASYLFEQRSHQLAIDVPKSGLLVEVDPVRLAQVIANILTNAARYTEAGGEVSVRAWRDSKQIVIAVRDNGSGISPEMLPRIFDAFAQGKRSPDRAEGGLGIGLTLVKSLVEMHGGSVHAYSEGLGCGSEFTIQLPASAAALTVAKEPSSPFGLTPQGTQQRVLVVDDNGDAAESLCALLENAGHLVKVANDPIVALALFEEFRPDVAVLDIGLPVIDGYELAARIQTTPQGASCRLIALTGYGQAHDHARSQQAGFTAHFVKPVAVGPLLAVIGGGPDGC